MPWFCLPSHPRCFAWRRRRNHECRQSRKNIEAQTSNSSSSIIPKIERPYLASPDPHDYPLLDDDDDEAAATNTIKYYNCMGQPYTTQANRKSKEHDLSGVKSNGDDDEVNDDASPHSPRARFSFPRLIYRYAKVQVQAAAAGGPDPGRGRKQRRQSRRQKRQQASQCLLPSQEQSQEQPQPRPQQEASPSFERVDSYLLVPIDEEATESDIYIHSIYSRSTSDMSTPPIDEDAVAAADKEMEERANRAKELLSNRYVGLKRAQEDRKHRKMQLERTMIGLPEEKKQTLRGALDHEEMLIQKDSRKQISTADFESLVVIGRGAFGEVRLVRQKARKEEPIQIFALKSMKKEMMVIKNQVGHVRAEREALAKADSDNKWLTALHYSFVDESHLYMVMEYLPGGDLMSLLIKEDTFSESITRFFMAEAAHAISSVHALGYIHRDIKPDNMLLDSRGHLKLTDLGLCKKVGEPSPMDDPNVVLKALKLQGLVGGDVDEAAAASEEVDKGQGHGKHRTSSDDAMAMSIDDNSSVEVGLGGPATGRPASYPTGKARREMAYSTVGTPDYIAPEVLAAQNGASGYSYTCAVDWWSLGVIMFECLVGYTPFYAEDPVTTCRKILRWRQCLELPAETKAQLSPECIDFLSCLLAGPESRIGSAKNGTEFENGFKQVVQHPWFKGFDWEGLPHKDGPLLPSGSKEFPELFEYLKTCPTTDPRFKQLVSRVTQNFDTFEDYGTNLDQKSSKTRVIKNQLDQFYDYQFRRTRKPRVPLPDMLE